MESIQTASPEDLQDYLFRLRQLREAKAVERSATAHGLRGYWSDPQAFVHDLIDFPEGQGPTAYQDEVLAAFPEVHRSSVRGPRGLGKSTLASWLVLWFANTRDGVADWKAVTTAGSWRQLTKYLWPEIHKWARRLKWSKLGRDAYGVYELLKLSLNLATGEAFAAASKDPALIEGAHADQLLVIFDESKAVPSATFDAVEGAFSGAGSDASQEAFVFSISTPGAPAGRFYDIQTHKPGYEDWWVRSVTKQETIAAGRLSQKWCDQRKRQWGATSALYLNQVEGQFAASDEDGVIPSAWLEAAMDRWCEWAEEVLGTERILKLTSGEPLNDRTWEPVGAALMEHFKRLDATGVDVAGGGGDRTVEAPRIGLKAITLRRYDYGDTMQTAGRVGALLSAKGGTAVIDANGLGAGVFHRLREQGKAVEAFVGSERSLHKDRSGEWGFTNRRSEAYFHLRDLLNPMYEEDVCLPPDPVLQQDLLAPTYREMSGGKIQVEPKLEVQERLGRSPDDGDAVVMAYISGGPVGVAYYLSPCPTCAENVLIPPPLKERACSNCGTMVIDQYQQATEDKEPEEHNPWMSVYSRPKK